MHVLSRQKLFDMAWERPLTKVAAELGVTSTALKKTCRRHNIPTPSRGYWAAVAAGGVFPKPKLSPVSRRELETIHIIGVPPVPEAVRKATEAARARMAAPQSSPPPGGEGQPQPAEPARAIEAAAGLPEPRRELTATARAIAKAKAKPGEMASLSGRGVVRMTLSPELGSRALAWLEQLLRAGEAQGIRLEATETGARVAIDGEAIGFHIEEKLERTPHLPTAKELAEKAERDRWGYRREPWPKYDYSPSGQLSLIIDEGQYSGLRQTYSDRRTQTLESMTGEILVGFAAHAAAVRERRIAAEESRRRAAEAEARRQRLAAYQQREERRQKFSDLVAAKLDERARLTTVLSHLNGAGEPLAPPHMGDWLRRRIAEIDALLTPEFLELSARSAKLDFDEGAAVARAAAEPSWYYPRGVTLELWSVDEDSGKATSLTSVEWAEVNGLIAVPQVPAPDDA